MKHFKKMTSAILFASVVLCACHKDDNDQQAISSHDKNFLVQATYANRAEVELGQLALQRSLNDSVQMFAQMMVDDHTAGLHKLDSLANFYHDIDLPNSVDSMHAALKQQLATLTGHSFDSAYINSQIADHHTAINLFSDEATNGTEQRLRDFSNQTLPELNVHLQLANSVMNTLH
jgi:putative membrane protein